MKKTYYFILPVLIALNCLIFYYQYCVNDSFKVSDIFNKNVVINKRSATYIKDLKKINTDNPVLIETIIDEKIDLLTLYYNAADSKLLKSDETYNLFLLSEYKDNLTALEADIMIYKSIKMKLTHIINYVEYIENIPHTADLLSNTTLYRANTGWVNSNISKTVKDFYGLDKITLSFDNDEGLNLLINHWTSNIFAIFISIVTALIIFEILQDETKTALLTKRNLFIKGSLVLFMTIFILYLAILFMTEAFFGLGDLSRSLQSSESFINCTLVINTGTFLFLWFVSKLAACFILFAVSFFIITLIKQKSSLLFTIMPVSLFFIIQLILYTNNSYSRTSILLREINFFSAFDPHRFFVSYLNLNFFGQAVSRPIVFIVFIFTLLSISGTAAKRGASSYQAKALTDAEKAYFDEINEHYNEFRGIWHDIQNHLLVLNRLIDDNNTESAKNYINEFNEKLMIKLLPPKTGQRGSAVLDALLYKKLETAGNNNIDLKFDIAASFNDFRITDYELCSILGNVLDNAIEAVLKLPLNERCILLSINRRYDMLYICCENPYCGELIRKNESFLSIKTIKSLHGIGLMRINGLVKKHNGLVNINTNDNVFKIEILLNST